VVILGRKFFRRDDLHLAQERKPELNKYMSELLKLNENISHSKLVLDFFAPQEVSGDMDRKDLLGGAKEGKLVNESKSGNIQTLFKQIYMQGVGAFWPERRETPMAQGHLHEGVSSRKWSLHQA
jgi:hypothetical protein